MAAWIIGAALGPFAAALLVLSLRCLFVATRQSPAALPFLAGFLIAVSAWAAGRIFRPQNAWARFFEAAGRQTYIFGHELSHALAAWISGARIFAFHVGKRSGHVDLDKSNALIALAPYCLPIYTAVSLLTWRGVLAFKPHAPAAPFLALLGLTLAFHLTKTLEYVWDLSQPDLKAAGGILFSLSVILGVNGLVILALARALFSRAVGFTATISASWLLSLRFWSWAAVLARAAWRAVAKI